MGFQSTTTTIRIAVTAVAAAATAAEWVQKTMRVSRKKNVKCMMLWSPTLLAEYYVMVPGLESPIFTVLSGGFQI